MLLRLPVLTLALFMLLGALSPARSLQEPTACQTCEGQGQLMLGCELCEGDGKGPCQECVKSTDLIDPRVLAIKRRTEPEDAAKFDEQLASIKKMQKEMQALMGSAGMGAQFDPGSLKCPAGCRDGVSFLNRGHPCLPCKGKGAVRCSSCKGKGETQCAGCVGKRQVLTTCPECRGAGEGRDPLLRQASELPTCPWCAGEDLIECRVCDDTGLCDRGCTRCARSGETLCSTCSGTAQKACNKCSGTGDLSSYYAKKDSNRCDKCKRKGSLPCDACKKGKTECVSCKGEKRGLLSCLACYGTRHAPCHGCWESSGRAWEVTGDRLLKAERPADAAAHYDEAILREKLRHQAVIDSLVEMPKERKATKKRLEADLKALSKKAAKARKLVE